MVAFLYRIPAGIPGSYDSAGAGLTVEPGLLDTTALPAEFGHAVAINASNGKYRALTSSDTAALVAGVLVRPYPHASWSTSNGGGDPLGSTAPVGIGAHSILKRGYAHVTLRAATAAAKGGIVYLRVATPGTNKVIGGIEAVADSTNTIAMPSSWFFMGPADSLGNVKIGINI